jgi:hypothetical protein
VTTLVVKIYSSSASNVSVAVSASKVEVIGLLIVDLLRPEVALAAAAIAAFTMDLSNEKFENIQVLGGYVITIVHFFKKSLGKVMQQTHQ